MCSIWYNVPASGIFAWFMTLCEKQITARAIKIQNKTGDNLAFFW